MFRIVWIQAFFIVTYALGIYLLNLFLAFLQPKFDPSLEMDIAESEVEEGAPGLPTSTRCFCTHVIVKDADTAPRLERKGARVQAVHKAAARVQVLALCNPRDSHVDRCNLHTCF